MKFSLFLGAGASVPLGFPDTTEFKTLLEESLEKTENKHMLYMLQKSRYDDIENVLTAIEALIDLSSNPGYNLMKNTIKITYEYMPKELGFAPKSFDEIVNDFSAYKEKIQNYIYEKYSWKNASENASKLYDSIFYILKQSDDGIHICTTNYDQAMEKYIDRASNLARRDGSLPNSLAHKYLFHPDGFSNTQQNVNPDTTPCNLYKLHGSLSWVPDGDEIHMREDDESPSGNNFIIYPTLSPKDYKRKPYKTILQKFIERINNTDIFIIIGFSFRDKYIRELFQEFLRRDGTKMFVISPSAKDDTIRELREEFSYSNIHFHGYVRPKSIRKYNESLGSQYDGAFKVKLYEYFTQLNISIDAKVYTLDGTLEEIIKSGILDIVLPISNILSGKL